LTQSKFPSSVNSAAGAALSSHGRKAVDQAERKGLRPARAGIVSAVRKLYFSMSHRASPRSKGIRRTSFDYCDERYLKYMPEQRELAARVSTYVSPYMAQYGPVWRI
jgi:hypothetical protein